MKNDPKKKRRFRQSLARFLQNLQDRPLKSPPYTGPTQSFVLLAQEKLGDAILLTPLLKHLRILFPESSLTVITFSKSVYDFFQSDSLPDKVFYAKGNLLSYIRNVLMNRYDILFNTKDHPSTNFLLHSLLIPATCKAGIDNPYHKGLYDYLVKVPYHIPMALKNCGFLRIVGKEVSPQDCRPTIPTMPISEEVNRFISNQEHKHSIGINISAGRPERYWTEEKWQQIVTAFPNERFTVMSSPADLEQKKSLESACDNIIPSPETRNIYEASLLTKTMKLLVTPDTAIVHVASSTGTPLIGLYREALQDQSRFAPFLVDYRLVISQTARVQDITVEQVSDALRNMNDLKKVKRTFFVAGSS